MIDFFASGDVRAALLAGTIVAVLSSAAGFFTIVRGLTFAGHAVTDVGLTGGAGALLIGVDPLVGLVAFSIGAATGVGALGGRERERDLATGLVLAFSLGLGALFLHLQSRGASGRSALLFGSIFDLDRADLVTLALAGAASLTVLAAIGRALLFASVAPSAARARGVPVRALGYAFLVVMALAVAETAQVVGVLISTALLVGPAASAIAWTRTPARALALGAAFGCLQMWAGIALAYASFGWPGGHGWPLSFFVAGGALATYLASAFLTKRN